MSNDDIESLQKATVAFSKVFRPHGGTCVSQPPSYDFSGRSTPRSHDWIVSFTDLSASQRDNLVGLLSMLYKRGYIRRGKSDNSICFVPVDIIGAPVEDGDMIGTFAKQFDVGALLELAKNPSPELVEAFSQREGGRSALGGFSSTLMAMDLPFHPRLERTGFTIPMGIGALPAVLNSLQKIDATALEGAQCFRHSDPSGGSLHLPLAAALRISRQCQKEFGHNPEPKVKEILLTAKREVAEEQLEAMGIEMKAPRPARGGGMVLAG